MQKTISALCLVSLLFFGACARETVRGRSVTAPEVLAVEGAVPYNVKNLSASRNAVVSDAQKNAVRRIAELFIDETSRGENYAALENGLLKNPQRYVAKYKVLSEGADGALYRAKVNVWLYFSEIASALHGLNLSGAQGFKPRAALVSRETGDGSDFVSSFKGALLKQSVIFIDDFSFTKDKKQSAGTDKALLAQASEAGADLLLLASATASSAMYGGGLASGFFPSRADATVKVYDVRTGAVLFLVARQGSAIDSSEAASFAKSLASAGEVLAQETSAKAERMLKTDVPVQITVYDLNGIEALEKLKAHFLRLDIKALRLENYSAGKAVFSVVPNHPGTQELASAALRGDPLLGLALEGVSPQLIVFTAATNQGRN